MTVGDAKELPVDLAQRIATALGKSRPWVYICRKRGMPVFDGVEACRDWLIAQRRTRPRLGKPQTPRDKTPISGAPADAAATPKRRGRPPKVRAEPAAPAEPAAAPPAAGNRIDLESLWRRLPKEVQAKDAKDAYEWLRVMKLAKALDDEAQQLISKEHAMALLVERARALRQTLLTIPRRVQSMVSDEVFAKLNAEIRRALDVYAAPEGYLDQLMPAEALATSEET